MDYFPALADHYKYDHDTKDIAAHGSVAFCCNSLSICTLMLLKKIHIIERIMFLVPTMARISQNANTMGRFVRNSGVIVNMSYLRDNWLIPEI